MNYCFDLARTGGLRIAEILATEVLDNAEHTLTNQCCLVNVRLPLEVMDDGEATLEEVGMGPASRSKSTFGIVPRSHVTMVTNFLTARCVEEHSTFIAFIFYRNAWWARLSAQIYLDLEDFEYGGFVLRALCESVSEKCYMTALPPPVFCC